MGSQRMLVPHDTQPTLQLQAAHMKTRVSAAAHPERVGVAPFRKDLERHAAPLALAEQHREVEAEAVMPDEDDARRHVLDAGLRQFVGGGLTITDHRRRDKEIQEGDHARESLREAGPFGELGVVDTVDRGALMGGGPPA